MYSIITRRNDTILYVHAASTESAAIKKVKREAEFEAGEGDHIDICSINGKEAHVFRADPDTGVMKILYKITAHKNLKG